MTAASVIYPFQFNLRNLRKLRILKNAKHS